MSEFKYRISPFVYHVIVPLLTTLVASGVAFLIVLIVTNWRDQPWVLYVFGYLLFYSLITGIITGFVSRWSDRKQLIRAAGLLPTRLVGLFTGILIGSELAGGVGAVAGAIALYMMGRLVGPKISTVMSRVIENLFSVREVKQYERQLNIRHKWSLSILYIIGFPTIFIFVALILEQNDIQVIPTSELLSFTKIVFPILSLITIGIPWLIKGGMLKSFRAKPKIYVVSEEFSTFLIGLIFSSIPVIYGFLSFLFGATILQMVVLIGLSILASAIWTIAEYRGELKAG